jgi:hypothetical protein
MAFTSPILTKLKNAQQYYVWDLKYRILTKLSTYVENMDIN